MNRCGSFRCLAPHVSSSPPGLRVTFRSPYAIYYLPQPDAVVIVRIIHGARDIAASAERGGFG